MGLDKYLAHEIFQILAQITPVYKKDASIVIQADRKNPNVAFPTPTQPR
jgi:hypothetical protein